MNKSKKIISLFLIFVLCFINMNISRVYSDGAVNTHLYLDNNSVQLDSKLLTLEQYLKDIGKLDEDASLFNLSGEIPVLITLKEKEEYTAKGFSFSSIESICKQITLSEDYYEEFLGEVKERLQENTEFKIVSHVLNRYYRQI